MENQKAFPTKNNSLENRGMDLRDYFAAKAMQAIIENWEAHKVESELDLANKAYRHADAMIEARNQPTTKQ